MGTQANKYNNNDSSISSVSEGVNLDSFRRSSSDSICGGGSLTPKQCLGARPLKEMLALVGHKTPMHHLCSKKKVFALVGHRHPRDTCFWIEEFAPVHTGIGCTHSIRRGARDILCISPYGQVGHDCSCIDPTDIGSSACQNTCLGARVNYREFAW